MSTAQDQLQAVREFMSRLPADCRKAANEFWRQIRAALNEQDYIIHELRDQLRNVAGGSVVRPRTSDSVNNFRWAVNDAMQLEAQRAGDASRTIEAICDLPMEWANNFISRQRDESVDTYGLGCWENRIVSGHSTGYVKFNMRNTVGPMGSKLDVQPWAHQMAVVAQGNGAGLRLTQDGSYHASHLCHNPRCFNPEHIIVEEYDLNMARNSCKHSFIIICPDGTTIHPCTHWRNGRQRCILQTRRISRADSGKWLDMTNDGPIRRTGSNR
jgi:hypothetical protein